MFLSLSHRGATYLKAQGDSRACIIHKQGIVPSNERIEVPGHDIGQRDPVPPRTTGERNWVLRDKRVKVVLSMGWDIWALRDHPFTSTLTIALGVDRGRRPVLNRSQPVVQFFTEQPRTGRTRGLERPTRCNEADRQKPGSIHCASTLRGGHTLRVWESQNSSRMHDQRWVLLTPCPTA